MWASPTPLFKAQTTINEVPMMHSLTIAPFSRLLWFATPLPGRHVQISGQSVKQKATWILNTYSHKRQVTDVRHTQSSLMEAQKSARTGERKTATRLSWGSLKSSLFFLLNHAVVTGCYLRTQDKKGGLFFGMNSQSCHHKWSYWWNLFSFSCSEKHQRMSKIRNSWWGDKSPSWGAGRWG